MMADGYVITPQPAVGQGGSEWVRWLDRCAHERASSVETISVRDFPPMVLEQIGVEEIEGEEETATEANFQVVLVLMARLGYAHGLQAVSLTLQDAVYMTQILVLDKTLTTLRESEIIGNYYLNEPPTGRAELLGGTLKQWLEAAVRCNSRDKTV